MNACLNGDRRGEEFPFLGVGLHCIGSKVTVAS